MLNEIETLIQEALSPNTQVRNNAEQKLLILQQSNFSYFIANLTQLLTTEETRSDIRFTAGIIARNSLNTSNYLQNQQIEKQWLEINANIRNSIKQALYTNFSSTNQRSSVVSANVLACISRIEIINGIWPDFYTIFFNEYKNTTNINIQKNILTTVSCSLLYLKDKAPQNQIYPILTYKLNMYNENQNVENVENIENVQNQNTENELLLHNLKILNDSQENLQKVLSENATYFVNLLTSILQKMKNTENIKNNATNGNNINNDTVTEIISVILQNIANLVTFAIRNIKNLASLFNFVIYFMEGDNKVILQAIEFYTVVSEYISNTKVSADENVIQYDSIYICFKEFVNVLLPKLFYHLKKSEDYDDDEWSPHKASSSCLEVISSFCNILGNNEVKRYIQNKIECESVYEREEGMIALGSSLHYTYLGGIAKNHELYVLNTKNDETYNNNNNKDYNNNYTDYNNNYTNCNNYNIDCSGIKSGAFKGNNTKDYIFVYNDDGTANFISEVTTKIIIEMQNYHNTRLEGNEDSLYTATFLDSCLYSLAKICETNLMTVKMNDFDTLMNICQVILQMKQKESINAAWVIANACKSIANLSSGEMYENQLTLNYYAMLDVLVCTSDNVEFTNFILRNAIFNAIQEYVRACAISNFVALDSLWKYFLKKIYEFLSYIESANDDQFNILEDLICNCVILMHTIYLKMDTNKNISSTLKKENLNIYLDILSINKVSIIFADIYSCLSVQCHAKSFFIDNIDKFIFFIKRDLFVYDSHIVNSAVTLIGDIANSLNVGFLSCSKIFMPALIDCLQRKDIPEETKVLIINVFGDISMSLGCSFEPYLDICISILEQIINLNREGNEEHIDELRKGILNLISCILISMDESKKWKRYIPGIVHIMKVISNDRGPNLNACFNILADLGCFYGLKEDWMYEILSKYENDEVYGKNAKDIMDKVFEGGKYTVNNKI